MLYEYQTEPLLKRLRDGEIDLGSWRCRCRRTAWSRARCTRRPLPWRCRPIIRSPPNHHQGAGPEGPDLAACWRTATACATRRWRFAAASTCARPRIFAPPASRPCGKWWSPDSGSPCCPKWRSNRRLARSAACRSGISQACAVAHGRRGMAQVEHPRGRDRRGLRRHCKRHGTSSRRGGEKSLTAPRQFVTPVSALRRRGPICRSFHILRAADPAK